MSEEKKEEIRNKLYVGNLSRSVEKDALKSLFERCGEVKKIQWVQESIGVPRGWALVEMDTEQDAKKAVQFLHMYAYKGKQLKVSLYRRKTYKSSTWI